MPRIPLYTVLLTFAAWSADAAEVRLKSEATCSGAVVRLKDVAEIVSGDEGEAAALAELQLFPVPSAGKTRLVRKGEIHELLALSDVNLKAVIVSGADKLVIRREGARSAAKPQAAGAVVASALITPSTKVSSQPSESIGVELIPVAVRPLERGAVLRSADLELRTAPPSLGRGQPPLKIADLVGKELLRALPAGQPISGDLVQSQRLVHRGDKVTVKALASGVVVTISGKALEEGGSGDNVLVEDSTTKEKLVTRVSGYQAVEVLGTGVKSVR
jgi:flagellar basal body P-ring formation protein FlgA